MFWALSLEFRVKIENLKKNPHFFCSHNRRMCPQIFSLVALPTQPVTGDRVFFQQLKTAFHREFTKANHTTNWCAAHDSKDSINKSIQDYKLWIMPYDHAYDA
jgi:hypothetical protein